MTVGPGSSVEPRVERGSTLVSDLSFGEVGEILQLLQAVDGTEIDLEWGDLRIQVRRGNGASPDPARTTVPSRVLQQAEGTAAAPHDESPQAESSQDSRGVETLDDVPAHWVAVVAPMAGTFYRSPTPEAPPFVEVGDVVSEGDTVALIEVMKLFTDLKSEVSGKVARIDGVDGALVDYGSALVWIEPA
jgi:acetyl-CoA carboxylase biotin carboxyl carrier protein